MEMTCSLCPEPATCAVLTRDADAWGNPEYSVTPSCDGHAPEVMHELIASGYTTDEMVRVTINKPVGGT